MTWNEDEFVINVGVAIFALDCHPFFIVAIEREGNVFRLLLRRRRGHQFLISIIQVKMDCMKGNGSYIRYHKNRPLFVSDAFMDLDPKIVECLKTISARTRHTRTPGAIITYAQRTCGIQFRPDIYHGGCVLVSVPFDPVAKL